MEVSVDRCMRSRGRTAERDVARAVRQEGLRAGGAAGRRCADHEGAIARARLSLALAAICRLAIIATGVHWLVAGNGLWAVVAAVALLLTVVPMALIGDPVLRDAARGVLALLLAAHVVLGMLGGLYETSPFYDKWTHLLGSGALAALGIVATRRAGRGTGRELPLSLRLLLVLTGTLSLGTLWELFEFGVDRTGLFRSQRGLDDTMLDLLADAAGASLIAVLFAAWVAFRGRGGAT